MMLRSSIMRHAIVIGALLAGALVVPGAAPASAQSLVAAVLPSSRSVQVNATATAFATVINTGSTTAMGCRITLATSIPAAFTFRTTDPVTNEVTGAANAPVDIAAGSNQSFVIALTPTGAVSAEVQFGFVCDNTSAAPVFSGLNTLLLTASTTPGPDIVAMAATTGNDGIVTIPSVSGTGVFSVATSNIGASSAITVTADTGVTSIPVSVTLCETNAATGACTSSLGPSVSTTINANGIATFGVFVQGLGSAVDLDPATKRVFVRFRDPSAMTQGSTSVAVRTATSANAPATAADRGAFLTAADVTASIRGAAESLDGTTMAIAVVDRMGNPLGVFRKPDTPANVGGGNNGTIVDANELALSLARTGAFFSNNEAPLSSRTVRFISGIHFPPGITGKPNAALYGIENTNRGCEFNAPFNAGRTINPPKALNGLPCNSSDRRGCSLGISTGKANTFDTDPNSVNGGGVPIFKDGQVVGGIGVSGVDFASAEFAAFIGSVSAGARFGPQPAAPGVIYLDGIRLPFVVNTARPVGRGPGTFVGSFVLNPIDSPLGAGGVPEGYLIGPRGSAELTASEVDRIVQQAIAQADFTRAAIRLPQGTPARFVMAVADLQGNLLALFRQNDSTIFSIDVALTKARNVVYFSGPTASPNDLPGVPLGTAVSNRTISFGAQPLYPPGIDNSGVGPFFQAFLNDVATPCTQGLQAPNLNQSGIVFFPGSLPLYKNGQMVGGLGVSGDGVEQDDLATAGGATGFVPAEAIRADRVFVRGIRLPLLKFPRNPEAGTRGD